jgi:hypothetical protein
MRFMRLHVCVGFLLMTSCAARQPPPSPASAGPLIGADLPALTSTRSEEKAQRAEAAAAKLDAQADRLEETARKLDALAEKLKAQQEATEQRRRKQH